MPSHTGERTGIVRAFTGTTSSPGRHHFTTGILAMVKLPPGVRRLPSGRYSGVLQNWRIPRRSEILRANDTSGSIPCEIERIISYGPNFMIRQIRTVLALRSGNLDFVSLVLLEK